MVITQKTMKHTLQITRLGKKGRPASRVQRIRAARHGGRRSTLSVRDGGEL